MNRLARLTLRAYPKTFRRDFGSDYLQAANDLRRHGDHTATRVALRLVGEAMTVAPAMRWENRMRHARSALLLGAAVAALLGLVMGSEAIALLVVAAFAIAVLVLAGNDRPITASDPAVTRHWYRWLVGAAAAFLAGIAVLAIDGDDDDLSEAAWTGWMLSWTTAALLALIGTGLGATRLLARRT